MGELIKSDFPFKSKFVNVYGSKMHYIDENDGEESNQTTFILLHGNPSSNYLWRNIIPELIKEGRVIAPDLMGFGKSDKPQIDYKALTHAKYIEEFINILKLNNIVFVLHDWGVAIGLYYARQYESKIKGVAFMEGVVKPKKWDFGKASIRFIFRLFRTPIIGKWMVMKKNFFVERILLHLGTKRNLTAYEKQYYAAPFHSEQSRKPVYVFPNEIPINRKPRDVYDMVQSNHEWLSKTEVPKLLLWVKPGVLIKPWHVIQMQERYPNLYTEYLGLSSKGFLKQSHYVQEDFPFEIANAVTKWFRTKNYLARLVG